MLEPLITVAIPTHNGAKHIGSAIESVLNQTYKNLELLICDNASTDNTPDIISLYINTDSRIRYYRHKHNIGFVQNYNSVSKLSNGEYVVFFADDDLLASDYIQLLYDGFIDNPDAVIVIGSIVLMKEDGTIIKHNNAFLKNKVASTNNLTSLQRIKRILRYGNEREWSWAIILGLIKKSVLAKHPYDSSILDPGIQYVHAVIYAGDIIFRPDALFYKRLGGISDGKLAKSVSIKSKFIDFKNVIASLKCELKIIALSSFSTFKKCNLFVYYTIYRLPSHLFQLMWHSTSITLLFFSPNLYYRLKRVK